MVKNFNKFTGEVMPFRTQFQKSDYSDNEVIEGESLTDTSDYEDINTTIDKCARAGLITQLEQAYYQGDSAQSFDDYDETQDSDYDISQAKQTLNEFQEQVLNSSQGEKQGGGTTTSDEPQTNSSETTGTSQNSEETKA